MRLLAPIALLSLVVGSTACAPRPGASTELAIPRCPPATPGTVEEATAPSAAAAAAPSARPRSEEPTVPVELELWVVAAQPSSEPSLPADLEAATAAALREQLAGRGPHQARLVEHLDLRSALSEHGSVKGSWLKVSHALEARQDRLLAFLQLSGTMEPIDVQAVVPLEPGELTLVAEVGTDPGRGSERAARERGMWLIWARATRVGGG